MRSSEKIELFNPSDPIEGIENKIIDYSSKAIFEKNKFLGELFNAQISNFDRKSDRNDSPRLIDAYNSLFEFESNDSTKNESLKWDGSHSLVTLNNWKNIENISSRLVKSFDDTVVLECLIDKDSKYYEEREFKKSLFEGYDLKEGKLFYLRFFERPNEMRMEVLEGEKLISSDDFPKMNFTALFKKSKLFKQI